MNLLVIGSGGREHAIAKKINQSPLSETVYCIPGNAGMKLDGIQIKDLPLDDHDQLIAFAVDQQIEWTIIGPEVPLFDGLADAFYKNGLSVFGPSKAATLIEASKAFAKELMVNQGIPTAAYQVFDEYEKAKAYIQAQGAPIVIKADGLASGKGVIVAETMEEAQKALKEMMQDNKFGESASQVVIEECLVGEEFSLMAFVNGKNIYPMPISQDHKRLLELDKGPNTGGMGAYSPVPHISEETVAEAIKRILKPAAQGLADSQTPFTGILYAGVIATESGPKTIEFNARFGDPETQVVLNRMESDLVEVITDILDEKDPEIKWKTTGVDLGVVVAAKGYPDKYDLDILIEPMESEDTTTYYAGVKEKDGHLYSNGGRIYLLEAYGESIAEAQQKIYNQLNKVNSKKVIYRKDIGDKAKRR
ncbi:phosphoribosylamine--glycine ligase [Marinilactibacillus sp. Marseille-P9653]|uniref:phosphoribosylamine--glycine ligase n=1 Tax=Marinilactibacillus sp. Marseille-P9653 TaxID=2866583 RepID=UPI001CE42351|nr:phosphoribosylamine--glycine ligase [Marinilactibacillus sp. Marseille-P9653]